jgi:hypothetical protein
VIIGRAAKKSAAPMPGNIPRGKECFCQGEANQKIYHWGRRSQERAAKV